MFKKKPLAVALSSVLVLALALVGCGTKTASTSEEKEVKPIIIKFSHVVTPDTPKGKAALKFKELAEQKTNGRVKVEVYPSSQLYGDKEELEACQSGNVQIIAPSVTKLVGLNPKFQYTDLPFLFPNNEAVYKFFASDAMKGLMNSLDKYNLQGLAVWPNGFKQFTNNKRPLITPDDFKGLKFRTQAGKVLEAQFKALGAGSATIPFGETYAALQQGTVDGQENTFNNIDTQKYQEIQKYLTVSNHGRIDYMIIVNKSFWSGLEPDIRKALDESMAEATKFAVEQADILDQKSKENLKNGGKLQFTELTPDQLAAFQKAMQPVYDEFESVISKELIDAAIKAGQN
ncbi:tripartite ATP-independent periplasmic transporter solute receptor, DctP family [Desulfosporosinus orientis DSM 765]|uniref:Tripartite ATP-independent periplasmic transporter solute receptor, DctP family n=1 Tax=Desulfosporosinus orientis (strain ATCC 19365 / DSM 765 / NCIMB 8382 / VKM B-1628 / Singapore I) TaxID=768706 RepID=G7WEZ6_DESOD|nr:TRAP transporter substrate-binding protein [Desulfosporosinus orientis]AET67325.1 tripartite ATP-independent periplasmic transporter solute receptor, DctP family [Desulfosporosinus orientis DSM 765]